MIRVGNVLKALPTRFRTLAGRDRVRDIRLAQLSATDAPAVFVVAYRRVGVAKPVWRAAMMVTAPGMGYARGGTHVRPRLLC